MDDEKFLKKVLKDLEPPQSQVNSLLNLRDNIRSCIYNNIGGKKSMFMAGSFKKDTMIRQHYDLDMFIIWSPDYIPLENLKNLFYSVENALKSRYSNIVRKKVGWRIPYKNEFHVDVVPSIQDESDDRFSYLYNCLKNRTLRTSMQIHMEHIQRYNHRDVIKLLKLWKFRQVVPIKTFLLEIMIHLACYDVTSDSLSVQLETVFKYIANNIVNRDFYDPANQNNIITEDLTLPEKKEIRDKANIALNREYWGQIFKNIR